MAEYQFMTPQDAWAAQAYRDDSGSRTADAYAINSKVSHNNLHWISDVDNNVWEPGVYGWHNIT